MDYNIVVKLIFHYGLLAILVNRLDKFLRTKAHTKPSWDLIHSITPLNWGDYYLVPDYFLIINTLLFIPELKYFDQYMLEDVGNVFISLHWIRFFAVFLTAMPSPTPLGSRHVGFSTTDHDLILSGHNIQSLMTTLIIGQVSSSNWIIFFSWICAIGNMLGAILTRHHYTIDVYLTVIIVYLTYNQYLVPID